MCSRYPVWLFPVKRGSSIICSSAKIQLEIMTYAICCLDPVADPDFLRILDVGGGKR